MYQHPTRSDKQPPGRSGRIGGGCCHYTGGPQGSSRGPRAGASLRTATHTAVPPVSAREVPLPFVPVCRLAQDPGTTAPRPPGRSPLHKSMLQLHHSFSSRTPLQPHHSYSSRTPLQPHQSDSSLTPLQPHHSYSSRSRSTRGARGASRGAGGGRRARADTHRRASTQRSTSSPHTTNARWTQRVGQPHTSVPRRRRSCASISLRVAAAIARAHTHKSLTTALSVRRAGTRSHACAHTPMYTHAHRRTHMAYSCSHTRTHTCAQARPRNTRRRRARTRLLGHRYRPSSPP
jgi:hypothetical protein